MKAPEKVFYTFPQKYISNRTVAMETGNKDH